MCFHINIPENIYVRIFTFFIILCIDKSTENDRLFLYLYATLLIYANHGFISILYESVPVNKWLTCIHSVYFYLMEVVVMFTVLQWSQCFTRNLGIYVNFCYIVVPLKDMAFLSLNSWVSLDNTVLHAHYMYIHVLVIRLQTCKHWRWLSWLSCWLVHLAGFESGGHVTLTKSPWATSFTLVAV